MTGKGLSKKKEMSEHSSQKKNSLLQVVEKGSRGSLLRGKGNEKTKKPS